MILLDTDHLNVLKYPDHPRFISLFGQLNESVDQHIATTVITVEEQMRGWLALIHRRSYVQEQVPAYRELLNLFDFFSHWDIIPFDEPAATQFDLLRERRIRIGSMDLKIASIALVHEAVLLSANLRDFQRVPNLRVLNWIS